MNRIKEFNFQLCLPAESTSIMYSKKLNELVDMIDIKLVLFINVFLIVLFKIFSYEFVNIVNLSTTKLTYFKINATKKINNKKRTYWQLCNKLCFYFFPTQENFYMTNMCFIAD